MASLDGVTDAEGSQVAHQTSNCEAANCNNFGDMFVGLGIDNQGIPSITGSLETDYHQELTQTADCVDSNCANTAAMWYFATAQDGSIVTSNSNQQITQSLNCNNQNCLNTAFMVNSVFASGNCSTQCRYHSNS